MTFPTSRVPHDRGPAAQPKGAIVGLLTFSLFTAATLAQQAPVPPQDPEHGKVVFSSGQTSTSPDESTGDVFPKPPVTNDERAAVVIVSDDLDLHLTPADAREEGHAILTLRNTSATALTRIPLQLTSTMRWQSVSTIGRSPKPIAFTQSPVTTDADHTGYAQEAVLDHPLAPGATLTLSVFYAGQIAASTSRLELVGTPVEKAVQTDWDLIASTTDEASTALRGFGEVLWYPVAAPTAVLGEGNTLFTVIARQRKLNMSSTMRLRLTIVYAGDPPNGVLFNGRLQPLIRTPDNANQVVDENHGVATAEFAMQPIGFRTPNLFVTGEDAAQTSSPLLSAITPEPASVEPYAAAVQDLQPLFTDWIAPAPNTPLLLLEHAGLPFEDDALIVAHLSATAEPGSIAPELVRGLTHAFFTASAPTSLWLDQGLPEFMSLLFMERTAGRTAALAQVQQNAVAIAFAEPDFAAKFSLPASPPTGFPLTSADTDVYIRLKSAAVLWQLREILGEDLMRRAVAGFRHSLALNPSLDRDPAAFEKSLEKSAGVDLSWFFDDWVYHDRGLPDLTVTQAVPRPILPKTGHPAGYLVAVDVRNDGGAVADVPVTVRSGSLTATERLRVPGHSTASTRVVFEGTPETVQVNDGSVPELRESIHTTAIVLPTSR